MNIILFHPAEVELPLPRSDARARHIIEVLRREPGDTFDAGLINGPRGTGSLVAVDPDALTLKFAWGEPPPPLPPIHLLIGLPRPQTARDILRDATSLGVASLHFIRTDKGEASYAGANLWLAGEWTDHLIQGAAQAFCTRLPEVTHGRSLTAALAALPADAARVVLDNYEATIAFSHFPLAAGRPVVLAVGPERGWSDAERNILRTAGFTVAHLGPRVLRTENAVTVAVTILSVKLGLL